MKFLHTADWHLGKLIQGVYMTEDQRYILDQMIQIIEEEKPDAVIIAGDLYDRAVPPTEAVQLLDDVLQEIVLHLKTPVLAIGGNHDSPSRLHFGSQVMKNHGLYLAGQMSKEYDPVILQDQYGEVHFHLIPYCDPSLVRLMFEDKSIRSHDDALKKITDQLEEQMDPRARHVFVGHLFATPYGEKSENTSDSERPLSIGGVEYVNAEHFNSFDYTALGHLHRAHDVMDETIRYAGSILKYSLSEANHEKGVYMVEMDGDGEVQMEKIPLKPKRDLRVVKARIEELYDHPMSDDYVFVELTDETPVLSPMEKVRSIYPNAMHVEQKTSFMPTNIKENKKSQTEMDDVELFQAFYEEIKGEEPTEEAEALFVEVLDEILREE